MDLDYMESPTVHDRCALCGAAVVRMAADGLCDQCRSENFLSEPPFCAHCGGTCKCDDWQAD
jgi:hypothetical protein